jgi:hypothetical protein
VPRHARAKTAVAIKNQCGWVSRVAHAHSQSRCSLGEKAITALASRDCDPTNRLGQ